MRCYYLIMAVLAFINMFVFFYRENDKKTDYYIKLLFILICAANLGYLALGVSQTLEEAVLANKITYLGGCFMPPVMAACMCALCNIKLPHWVEIVCMSFSVFVYCMVLTTGFSDFYYSGMELSKVYDATSLAVEHGYGYGFFYVILYGYMIADIVITVIAAMKKHVTKRNLYLLITLQSVTIISFLVGRAINPLLELMPFVYVVDEFILIMIHLQLSKYNLEDSIFAAMQQNNTTGYIVFDMNKKFIGCNSIAKQCMPVLKECRVDTVISDKEDMKFLYDWLHLFDQSEVSRFVQTWEYQDKYYECVIKYLTSDKKRTGYILELQDCTDRKNYMDLLSNYSAELEQQVNQQIQTIYQIQQKTILGMASMVENRDNNTGGHIKRTSDVIGILIQTIHKSKLLDLSEQFCQDLIKAAPMHDLGKIAIEDRILQKPGKFTDEEFEIMKTHAEKSAVIVEKILRGVEEDHFVDVAVNVARYHHEKWNGSGYPCGLSGEDIPIEARIMALADVYDALVSKRCYKSAMGFSQAYDMIIESIGTHFDPVLEKVFIQSREQLENYYAKAVTE